jgi:FlaA1/EpsC-like NDP-sugar epimerase
MPLISKEKIGDILRLAKEKKVEVKIIPSFYETLLPGGREPLAREIDVQDLLGRERVVPNADFLKKMVKGKRFLVTGGGVDWSRTRQANSAI